MAEPSINIVAVLVATIASTILGFLWYGPLFGKLWMKLSGMGKADMEKAKKKGMAKSYLLQLIATFVMAYVLAHFVDYAGAADVMGGITAGLWLWMGFIATISLGGVIWENKPWTLYFLNNAHNLIAMTMMGAILAVWV